MASGVQGRPLVPAQPPLPIIRRVYGFGSVFAKTIRDSRRATLLVGGLLGLILIGVSRAIVSEFSTPDPARGMGTAGRAVPPPPRAGGDRPVTAEPPGGFLSSR